MKSLLILCGAAAAAVVMSGCNPNRSSTMTNQPRGSAGQTAQEQQQPGVAASEQPGVAASPGVSQNQYKNPDTGTQEHNINAGANP